MFSIAIAGIVASPVAANSSETGTTSVGNVMTCAPYGVIWSQSTSQGCLSDNSVGMPTRIYCDSSDQPISVAAFIYGGHSRGPVRISVGRVKFTLTTKDGSRTLHEGSAPIRLGLDDTKSAGGLSLPVVLPILKVGTYSVRVDYSGGKQAHWHAGATPSDSQDEPHAVMITWPKASRTIPLVVADCSSNFSIKKVKGSLPAVQVSAPNCTPKVNYQWRAYAGKGDGNRELGVFKGCSTKILSKLDNVAVRKIALIRQIFPNTRWIVSRNITPPRIDYGELPVVAAWKVDKEPIWIREWSARTRSLYFGNVWPTTTPYIYPDMDLDRVMKWIDWFSCHTEPPQTYSELGLTRWLRNYDKWCQDYSFAGRGNDQLRAVVTNQFAEAPPPSRDLIQVVTTRNSPPGSCIGSATLWRKLHEDFQKTVQLRNNVKTTAGLLTQLEWRQMIFNGALAASIVVTAYAILNALQSMAGAASRVLANVAPGVASLESAPLVERLLLRLAVVERNSLLGRLGLVVKETGTDLALLKKQAATIAWLAQSAQFFVKTFTGSYEKEMDQYQLGWWLDLGAVVTGGAGLTNLSRSAGFQAINTVAETGSLTYGFASDVMNLINQSEFIKEHDLQLSEFLSKSRLYQKQLAGTYRTASQLKDSIDSCNEDLDNENSD